MGGDRPPRCARPRDRPERTASAPTPFRARRVLPRRPDTSRARQEHAFEAGRRLQAGRQRRDCRTSANRRPPSSLRVAPSCLKTRTVDRRSQSVRWDSCSTNITTTRFATRARPRGHAPQPPSWIERSGPRARTPKAGSSDPDWVLVRHRARPGGAAGVWASASAALTTASLPREWRLRARSPARR
jgi:hypothetical protein